MVNDFGSKGVGFVRLAVPSTILREEGRRDLQLRKSSAFGVQLRAKAAVRRSLPSV